MLLAQTRLIDASGKTMSFSPNVPELDKEISVPFLEEVLLTWQKDDTSPFVAMRLNREDRFGGMIDRLATRLSTWIVFKLGNRRYASFLRKHGVAVQTKELDWRPDDSPFGACHCLELPFLFGPWERWKDAGIVRGISQAEWEQRGRSLRRQWLDFIR
jgi:para-nitrobenzyl esterase